MNKIIAAAIFASIVGGCFDYSDGERVGTVVKFSRKGVFCKTWEGEMVLGGMRTKTSTHSSGDQTYTTKSLVANVWSFTVEDESLVPQFKAALESQEPIQVRYTQELVTLCRSDSEGNYFATEIVGGTNGK